MFFVICFIIPVIMMSFSFIWFKKGPRKINHFYGLRTKLSMKNRETWDYTHRHISRVWLCTGSAVIAITGILTGLLYNYIKITAPLIIIGQILILVISVFPTLIMLNKKFNRDGTPKQK